MTAETLHNLLVAVREGRCTPEDALARLKSLPFEDVGFALVDHHRALRCGFPEVVFCEGKTSEQVAEIFLTCAGQSNRVLATRAQPTMAHVVAERLPGATYHASARAITWRKNAADTQAGNLVILAAGTGDIPVAEEARVTAEIMGVGVDTAYDVGIAGLHRLLARWDLIQNADVIIAIAGMEGALPSVVGGLVSCPVIAVPSSIGYGASFQGLTALLAMLNSCAAGVTVVNIDNGFGAAYAAARMLVGRHSARPAVASDRAPGAPV